MIMKPFSDRVSYFKKYMKHFNYENDVVPKCFCFYDEVIVPELFAQKKLKLKEPVKSYWKIL